MKIGLVGLGKMGAQMVERLLRNNHEVVVIDVNQAAIERAASLGAQAAGTRQEMLSSLPSPAVIWLMIPSEFVQSEIEAWLAILPSGSIIIDGGNSDFRLTRQRAALANSKSVSMLDVGTSGGILGLQNGFSMMVGGDLEAFTTVEPVIASLAQSSGYKRFGEAGSGHFIKMVHNAIEYGAMESYAEGYRLMREGPYPGLDLSAVADVWQHGSIISSSLNEIIQQALNENPNLEGIDGYVTETGEAGWTLGVAKELDIPLPAVAAAHQVRLASQAGEVNYATKLLAAMRNKFGGHNLNK